jgi:hypothetical protein
MHHKLNELELRRDQLGQMICAMPDDVTLLEAELEQVEGAIAVIEADNRRATIQVVVAEAAEPELVRSPA